MVGTMRERFLYKAVARFLTFISRRGNNGLYVLD